MTVKRAKAWLYRPFNLKSEIGERIDRYEQEQARATKITTTLQSMPGGSPDPHKFDTVVISADEVRALENEYRMTWKEVEAVINQLEDSKYRRVLSLAYLDYDSTNVIAGKMHYSLRQTFRIKADAIRAIMSLNVIPEVW